MFDLKSAISGKFSEDVILETVKGDYPFYVLKTDQISEICKFLHTNENCYFDYFSCLTAVDLIEENKIELIYELKSIALEHDLTLKVRLDRSNAEILTVSDIWRSANWHEREAYDLFGVKFINHPDLRRILLPTNWEGNPLRKDYKVQEYFHGIKVEY